jgi:hypothetical protein
MAGAVMSRLPDGYEIVIDDDGDFWLVGPVDVTLFSEPGEPLLLCESSTMDEAEAEAIRAISAESAK